MQAAAKYTRAVEVSCSSSPTTSGSESGGGGGGGNAESSSIALAKGGLYDVVKILVDNAKEGACKEEGRSIKEEILSVLEVERAYSEVSSAIRNRANSSIINRQ